MINHQPDSIICKYILFTRFLTHVQYTSTYVHFEQVIERVKCIVCEHWPDTLELHGKLNYKWVTGVPNEHEL